MDETKRLARVSTLLDDAKEELEGWKGGDVIQQSSRAWKKIDEAQRLLLGDDATRPEDN